MTRPGWFSDPGGRTDQLRWWDGSRWTSQTRPIQVGSGPVSSRTVSSRTVSSNRPAAPRPPLPPGQPPSSSQPLPARRPGLRLLLVLGAVVLLLTLLGVVLTRPGAGPDTGTGPAGSSTPDLCLPSTQASAGPGAPGEEVRVSSGRMSVPALGPDWTTLPDDRVPFGRGMLRQQITVQDDPPWIVSLNVGTMVAGDGFLAPEQGVHLVMPCLIAEYYPDVVVMREDVVDEAVTVDGHRGWVLESELTFDIEGLDFDSERLILVIVDLDDGTAGAVVVDLPAIARDREPELRAALADIRVAS